ncbi:MAG: AAA family ATPase [Sulfitobacter sp.]
MDPRTNPFSPGAGVRPVALEGRDALLEDASIAMDRILNGFHANSMMLTGLRGVGKTVLLNRLLEDAKAKGFETAKFEVPDDSGGHLARFAARNLDNILLRLDRARAAGAMLSTARERLQAFAGLFKVSYQGFSVKMESAEAPQGADLEFEFPDLILDVARAAAARQTAVAFFIDEVQYLSQKELSALARACHEVSQSGVPFLLVATGLPQIKALTGEAKSYAERLFDFRDIGALDRLAATRALSEPARRSGAAFEGAAIDAILRKTQGYAYFLQAWAKFAWDEADESPITAQDVADADSSILAFLDEGFFRVRFDRCAPQEQRYLRAMADLGPGPHRSGDIAEAMGMKVNQVAPTRRSLISSGMIYSQRHGETAFTVPLFDQFMKRAVPDGPQKGT